MFALARFRSRGLGRAVRTGGVAAIVIGCVAFGGGEPAVAKTAPPQPTPVPVQSPPTPPAPTGPAITIDSPTSFAFALLRRGSLPATGSNVCSVLAWETAEGGQFVTGASQFNPLNTTKPMPGDSIFNSVGVRNYPDWATGLEATWLTLEAGFYDGIRSALQRGGDAIGVLTAITASPWGTKFADPAAALASCQGWAGDFDRKRLELQVQLDTATAAIGTEQAALAQAQAQQGELDGRYQTMAAQIGAARRQLGQFARELYISGIEPALASGVDSLSSGDPFAYELVKAFPSYAGDRKAQAVHRSLGLLAEVAGSRDRAAQAVVAATGRVQAAVDAQNRAKQAFIDLENRASSSVS